VFAALVALAKAKLDEAALAALRAEPDPEPDDLEALDAAWEDEEVTFGPGAATAACGVDSLSSKLRQARRPAPGLEPKPGAGPRTVVTTSPAHRV
jgi:nitrate reductase delta subunit